MHTKLHGDDIEWLFEPFRRKCAIQGLLVAVEGSERGFKLGPAQRLPPRPRLFNGHRGNIYCKLEEC